MKKLSHILPFILSSFVLFAGCTQDSAQTPTTKDSGQSVNAQAPGQAPGQALAAMPAHVNGFSGSVLETMNSGGYTYVNVDTGTDKAWAAAPQCVVKVGDKVEIPQGSPMEKFHSKTLDRDFDLIYFVPAINVSGVPMAGSSGSAVVPSTVSPAVTAVVPSAISSDAPAVGSPANTAPAVSTTVSTAVGSAPAVPTVPVGHPAIGSAGVIGAQKEEIEVTGIQKVDGGKTIAELYSEKAALAGKEVKVRGKVVKFNSGIMGKNWMHIKDGTGEKDSSDLTLTTPTDTAKVGDVIVVTGVLVADKDFGMGYKYSIIIEEAKLTHE